MLRITIYDDDHARKLCVEGSIRGPWVGELERVWRQAQASAPGNHLRADLRMVSYIDDNGKKLLRRMVEDGVELVAIGPMMGAVVKDIIARKKAVQEHV